MFQSLENINIINMKKFIFTIQNTYRAVKLLSNPRVASAIERELYPTVTAPAIVAVTPQIGKGSILPHKHYMVQILN